MKEDEDRIFDSGRCADKLAPEHPIVAEVLNHRGLTKLKSTYAEGLAAYIGEDSRIHSSFNQTITATDVSVLRNRIYRIFRCEWNWEE